MNENIVNFFSEDIDFNLDQSKSITDWLVKVAHAENQKISEVNYIFCSDRYLLELNKSHLDHDTYTDIITFQYDEEIISGDIFISIDRINENAIKFQVSIMEELSRVIVHGLLHMLGFKDKSDAEKKLMTEKENYYLSSAEFLK